MPTIFVNQMVDEVAEERADGPKAVVVGHGVSVHRELQDTWAQK